MILKRRDTEPTVTESMIMHIHAYIRWGQKHHILIASCRLETLYWQTQATHCFERYFYEICLCFIAIFIHIIYILNFCAGRLQYKIYIHRARATHSFVCRELHTYGGCKCYDKTVAVLFSSSRRPTWHDKDDSHAKIVVYFVRCPFLHKPANKMSGATRVSNIYCHYIYLYTTHTLSGL